MVFPTFLNLSLNFAIRITISSQSCFLNCGVAEDSCESLDCREIKPVNPKGNQRWIFLERTDAEAEAPMLWPPDAEKWLIRKDPDAGRDWRRKEKRAAEDEMVGWHHQFNGHELGQTPGDSESQGSLACSSPWGLQRVGHNLATEQQQLFCGKIGKWAFQSAGSVLGWRGRDG